MAGSLFEMLMCHSMRQETNIQKNKEQVVLVKLGCKAVAWILEYILYQEHSKDGYFNRCINKSCLLHDMTEMLYIFYEIQFENIIVLIIKQNEL